MAHGGRIWLRPAGNVTQALIGKQEIIDRALDGAK
jgi:hypothetical protein